MSFFSIFREWFQSEEIATSGKKVLFDGDIKEIAVRLALSGKGLEQEQKRIEEFYENKILPFTQELKGEEEQYDEKIRQAKEELNSQKELKTVNNAEIKRIEEHQESLQNSLLIHRHNINDAWHKVLSHRFDKGKEFFRKQHDRVIDTVNEDWRQIKETLFNQIEIERDVYNIRLENYNINKDEFDKRAEKIKEDREKVEARIEKAEKQTETLKTFGITRFTAQFLLIAGVVSLAGAGTVVANLLQDRSPGDDLITWIIKGFGHFFTSLSAPPVPEWIKPYMPIFIILLSIFLFLTLFYYVIKISNYLVKKFDKTWDPDSDDTESNSPKSKPADKNKSKSEEKQHNVFSFNLENLIRDYQGFKSYFDFFSPNIERKDYSRLIASFPYIFLVAVLIFILSTNPTSSNFTLSTAYIGIIVILLTTSCAVIYINKVIEPRWLNYIEQKNNPNLTPQSRISLILLNKEILLLVILLVFSLILASILPVSGVKEFWTSAGGWDLQASVFKHLVWGSLAIFVTLSSLGLAYGIVYQGIFHELDDLNRKSQTLRQLIEAYASKPIIGDPSFFQNNYTNDLISENMNRLHELEDNRSKYEMFEIFGNDYEFKSVPRDNSELMTNLISKARRVFSSEKPKEPAKRELRLTDYNNDPEAAKDFLISRSNIIAVKENIRNDQKKISELKTEITSAEEKQKDLENKLVDFIKQKTAATTEILKKINQLKEEKEKDLMIFAAAYTIGSVANRLLKDEDILASELINIPDLDKTNDFSSTLLHNYPFSVDALWKRNNSLVKVISYKGIINGRRSYEIKESESFIPENELIFIKEKV